MADYWGGLLSDLGTEALANPPNGSAGGELPEILTVPENNQDEINLADYYSFHGYSDNGQTVETNNTSNDVETTYYYDDNVDDGSSGAHQTAKGPLKYTEQDLSNSMGAKLEGIGIKLEDIVFQPLPAYDTPPHARAPALETRADYSPPNYTPPPPPPLPPPPEPANLSHSRISPSRKTGKGESLHQKMARLQSGISADEQLKTAVSYYGTSKAPVRTEESLSEEPLARSSMDLPPKPRAKGTAEFKSRDVNLWDAIVEKEKVKENEAKHKEAEAQQAREREQQQREKDRERERRRLERLRAEEEAALAAAVTPGSSSSSSGVEEMEVDRGAASLQVVGQGGSTPVGTGQFNALLIAHTKQLGALGLKQANTAVFAAAEALAFVRDLAITQASEYASKNVYISSFVGCVNESAYYLADRAKTLTDNYINSLTADDPEKRHLYKIKNSTNWQNILLRYSMASLTWKQRQLLEETRDGGTLDQMDLNRMMREMTLPKSNNKLMRLQDEYFYITTAPDNAPSGERSPGGSAVHSTVNDLLSNELVVKRKMPESSSSSSSSRHDEVVNELGEEASAPNTVAMEFIQSNIHAWLENEAAYGDDDAQFALARFFTAPPFVEATCCYMCSRNFSVILFRHHCRFCGQSVCEDHSNARRCIYRFGLIQPVRVCNRCKVNIDEIHRRDVLIWRESRVQAYISGRLIPYFNPTVDRGVDKAMRIADYSIIVAKNTLALNFPTKVLLETIDILKRYGLSGFTGLLLRKDFLESVETLKRISGMDDMFSMSLHELTACIYYKLAIDRGLRGCNPEGEKIAHAPHLSTSHHRGPSGGGAVHTANSYHGSSSSARSGSGGGGGTGSSARSRTESADKGEDYDCNVAHGDDVERAIRFAPLALKIVYELNPVDAQRLAKSQGWDTIYTNAEATLQPEQPVFTLYGSEVAEGSSAKFRTHTTAAHGRVKSPHKEAVLAIRGTQSIQDVVTDIRAAPQEFPPPAEEITNALNGECLIDNAETFLNKDHLTQSFDEVDPQSGGGGGSGKKELQWEWLSVDNTSTYACGGVSRSAMYILREVGPSLMTLYHAGYDIVIVGHSLGGAVAALLTYMLRTHIPNVYCVAYGCPSCVDAATADVLRNFVLNVVNHDDVICRITPQSIRVLMSELMLFREQVFKHIQQDWSDVMARAFSLWSPRWRQTHSKQEAAAAAAQSPAFQALNNMSRDSPSDAEVNMVVVEQEELPELWLPGRILHIYLHKGQYHPAEVSRTFPDLRRIEVQGNIFEDHRSKNILNALLEVRSVMHASSRLSVPPDWVPFNSANVCHCCQNKFTWHSTFRGDAQEFRDRYNCKHCGNVVCGPCSNQRRAIPKYGLLFPERICDTCIYKGDFALLK